MRPSVRAVLLAEDEKVELDGRLDEAFWKNNYARRRLPAARAQRRRSPRTRPPKSALRSIRDHLYIGVMLYDTEPGQIIGYQKQRDGSLRSDDRFMFILDTFLDGRSAYFFETNPAGLLGDGLLRAGSRRGVNKSWDGIWNVRVSRDDRGWSAEIEIPFRTLNFNPSSDTWGDRFPAYGAAQSRRESVERLPPQRRLVPSSERGAAHGSSGYFSRARPRSETLRSRVL